MFRCYHKCFWESFFSKILSLFYRDLGGRGGWISYMSSLCLHHFYPPFLSQAHVFSFINTHTHTRSTTNQKKNSTESDSCRLHTLESMADHLGLSQWEVKLASFLPSLSCHWPGWALVTLSSSHVECLPAGLMQATVLLRACGTAPLPCPGGSLLQLVIRSFLLFH